MLTAGSIALLVVSAAVLAGTQVRSVQEPKMEGQQMAVKDVIEPIYIYATQSGRVTFDQGDSGGNPFASALVEVLGSEMLRFEEFLHQLIALTETKSEGRQQPHVHGKTQSETWRVLPKPPRERRVALVVVFSDYSASDGAQSLPGAARVLSRVGDAFEQADFRTKRILNPDQAKLRTIFREFTDYSAATDALQSIPQVMALRLTELSICCQVTIRYFKEMLS